VLNSEIANEVPSFHDFAGQPAKGMPLKKALKALGWQPLGSWYGSHLHRKANGASSPDRWAVLDEQQREDLNVLLEPLQLEWEAGFPTRTFDLLMIGSRDPQHDDKQQKIRSWGAAISNIAFDRTECTVQLVTDQNRLDGTEKTVSALCGEPVTGGKPHNAVKHYGSWCTWPKPQAPAA
jgi:hypothetical protein